jgi:hypothetical protein
MEDTDSLAFVDPGNHFIAAVAITSFKINTPWQVMKTTSVERVQNPTSAAN